MQRDKPARALLTREIHGRAQQSTQHRRRVYPKRIELHVVFSHEPHDEGALHGDEEPADEQQFFDAHVALRQVFDQAHFLHESPMIFRRCAAGEELEEIRYHDGTNIAGPPEKQRGAALRASALPKRSCVVRKTRVPRLALCGTGRRARHDRKVYPVGGQRVRRHAGRLALRALPVNPPSL